jgi:hypothetical protein
MPHSAEQLRKIHTFKELLHYLEEKLDWPLHEYQFDELTFEYQPEELGLKEDEAAKVRAIHQLRPLQHGQPWGIFFVEFENKKLPVVVLRRILSHLVVKKRASANRAGEAAWHAEDLLFITTFGEDDSAQREIAFAHFHQSSGDLPTLHVLCWDGGDTPLKLVHLDSVLQQHLHWPDNTADHLAWRQQWASPFQYRIGYIISTASALAEALASLARGINNKAIRMLAVESENGPLRKLYKSFQTALIHDLTEASFADTYAQTITYGLLTAAISRTEWSEGRHGTFIVAENVADMVPITNPFLKEMLQYFLKVGGRKGGIDFDELGIQDVVELLRGKETNLPAILRDFGNRTPGEDPVIHFYEHFLSAYNKKLKIQRGVFYTPQPVVAYIIRSVHELLQIEFGLADGLASTITWGEMIKRHPNIKLPILTPKNPSKPSSKDIRISPESPFVMILDIATGTGTFLVEIIDVIHKTMKAKWQKQGKRDQEIVTLWNEYVPKHLLPRIYGYELMMAPYAIAHMKIGLKLSETGYKFTSDERVRVYLTNALEPASDAQQKMVGILPALAHEAEAVNAVKLNVRFTVLVGNPPYSSAAGGSNEFISTLMKPFMSGLGVENERKKGALQDDYIRFFSLMQHTISKSEIGVIGLITNNSYLDGTLHRAMRNLLRSIFSTVNILDLHGSNRAGFNDIIDENVFDIIQGVAIFVGTFSRSSIKTAGTVQYCELLGTRAHKYEELSKGLLVYRKLEPISPYYLFKPLDNKLFDEYSKFSSIADIFSVNSSGIETEKDHFAVDFECSTLKSRLEDFCNPITPDNIAASRYALKDTPNWSLASSRKILREDGLKPELFIRYVFHCFDWRYTYYSDALITRSRKPVMKQMFRPNIALVCLRQVKGEEFAHAFVASNVTNKFTLSSKSSNVSYHFPLFITDKNNSVIELFNDTGASSNINSKYITDFKSMLGLSSKSSVNIVVNGPDSFEKSIFAYIYGILYSTTYRLRYAEYLKLDFPRIPKTSSKELFRSLAKLGGKLVALHLLESPTVNNFITAFTGKGDNSIPKKPTWKDNAVWINPTQRFEGVPENVWNFHIGGYQVCEKWLKDRKGRTLSSDDITHYQRIVVALNETIRIMAEIDQVIDKHGGWPIK